MPLRFPLLAGCRREAAAVAHPARRGAHLGQRPAAGGRCHAAPARSGAMHAARGWRRFERSPRRNGRPRAACAAPRAGNTTRRARRRPARSSLSYLARWRRTTGPRSLARTFHADPPAQPTRTSSPAPPPPLPPLRSQHPIPLDRAASAAPPALARDRAYCSLPVLLQSRSACRAALLAPPSVNWRGV